MTITEKPIDRERGNPLFEVTAYAPVRICDLGGWTDTWFAKTGTVLNFAASPGVEVRTKVYQRMNEEPQVVLYAVDLGKRLEIDLNSPIWVEKDLLEAAVRRIGVPSSYCVEISVHSEPPPGCSVGTSASVTVAILAALAEVSGNKFSPKYLSEQAQLVETKDLGQQCGIQDQISAAFGGICFIEMFDYPKANIESVQISDLLWEQLNTGFCTFYLGKPHFSSDVHKMVISELERSPSSMKKLDQLRNLAKLGKDALINNDLKAFGTIMTSNTEAQRRLSERLISQQADAIIEVAQQFEALGWKVNGAGGPDGGSITVLGPVDQEKKLRMTQRIQELPGVVYLNYLHLTNEGLLVKNSRTSQ